MLAAAFAAGFLTARLIPPTPDLTPEEQQAAGIAIIALQRNAVRTEDMTSPQVRPSDGGYRVYFAPRQKFGYATAGGDATVFVDHDGNVRRIELGQ